jgi:KDO2-lipid IV(A) lauroyltransferase
MYIVKHVLLGLSKLPLSMLYVLSDFFTILIFRVARYRRKVVRHNLHHSFPEKSLHEIRDIEKKFYRHLSDIMAETLKNLGGRESAITKRISFRNIELLQRIYSEGKSVTLYTGHYGNWEWLAVLPLHVRFRMIAFYQPLSNSIFDELMKQSREKYGITAIPSGQAYRALKNFSDEGILTLSLVLGDQSPPPGGPKVWLDFLNQPTAFLTGANKIARKLDQYVVYPHFIKVSRGHYEVELIVIHPAMDDTGEHPIIRNYAAQLEKSIRHDPSMWLWSHRRWKLKPEED